MFVVNKANIIVLLQGNFSYRKLLYVNAISPTISWPWGLLNIFLACNCLPCYVHSWKSTSCYGLNNPDVFISAGGWYNHLQKNIYRRTIGLPMTRLLQKHVSWWVLSSISNRFTESDVALVVTSLSKCSLTIFSLLFSFIFNYLYKTPCPRTILQYINIYV